ncbi:serine/threonine-protein kinase fray2-like [Mya arenaria]|uniref:serine/threonine-protein kinase fray2-like n=1 Tax=Mya arenaria TaxID=6604 RepID=UPI0022E7A874|nr:serine/threonine-protein kinase fray2-like [Mya arenaria]
MSVYKYTFDPHTGDWKNKSFSNTMASQLESLTLFDPTGTPEMDNKPKRAMDYQAVLDEAKNIIEAADVAFKPRMKSASLGLRESMPKDKRRLRWFITPHEAAVLLADKDETWLDRKPYDMPFDLPHLPNRFPIDDDDNDGYASSTEEEAIVPPASYRDKYKETKDTYRGRTDKFKERFEREKNTKNRERDNVVKNKQDKEHNERYKTKIDRHNDMNDRDRNTNKTVRARGQSESRVKGYSEQYHDQRGYNSDTDDSWGHNPDNSRRNQGGYTKINATKAKYKKYQDALNKSQNRSDSYRAKREEAFEKIETHRSRKSVESDDYLGATSRSLPERKERVQVETTRGYSDSEYQARASFNTMPRKRERAPLPKYKR